MILTALTVLSILAAGFGMTFVFMRLAEQRTQSVLDQIDQVRPIIIVESEEKSEISSMEIALQKLDAMVGLEPVKQEVKLMTARMQVEQKRRQLRQGSDRHAPEIHGGQSRPHHRDRSRLSQRDAAFHRQQSRPCQPLQQDGRLPVLQFN